jgi:glycosyltransferase involved in cell wall biosynthesis
MALPMEKEIIVVDNNSTDGSYGLVEEYIRHRGIGGQVVLIRALKQGKGNAIKAGLLCSHGDVIALHDADLEYDPAHLPSMVSLLGKFDAVHGCRLCRPYSIGVLPFLANKLILLMMRKRYRVDLNDIFTGQRVYTRSAIMGMPLSSCGFELETELTIRGLTNGLAIKEVDVSYKPRSRAEGKKIGLLDFISIVYTFERLGQRLSRERRRVIAERSV